MTAPAGSEDAGLVLSAEEVASVLSPSTMQHEVAKVRTNLTRLVAARVEAARAEERERIADCSRCGKVASALGDPKDLPVCQWCAVEVGAEVERERIAAAIKAEKKNPGVSRTDYGQGYAEGTKDALDDAARIARTPSPAGDAQGSQEARNGAVSHGDAGGGRGHGRDDESGRGAGL